jgi:hypothetical protein
MNLLIGVDDTDNLESRGTGYRVRQLMSWLDENELAIPKGITRHQLLVDPQIPYTSHNSSACMAVETENAEDVWEACREYLWRESALGSDAGLCLAQWEFVTAQVMTFGSRAKLEVLTMPEAEQTAASAGIRLAGLSHGDRWRNHWCVGRRGSAVCRRRWSLPLVARSARIKGRLSGRTNLFDQPY